MQKGPLPKEQADIHRERVRAGQARARAAGKRLGRPSRYSDHMIRSALQRHAQGETWAAIAGSLGMPEGSLYDRLRVFRREDRS